MLLMLVLYWVITVPLFGNGVNRTIGVNAMENPKDPYRWIIASLWFGIVFFSAMGLFCMPPLFTEIGRGFFLTKAQMGIIYGASPLASLFLAFLAGSISDRFGSRWVVGGSLFVTALSCGFRAFADNATELIIYSFSMGVGMAIFGPNIAKVLGNWFPRKELGKANGIVVSAIPISGALTLATAADVMSPAVGGWRGVMVAVGGACLVMTVLWVALYREKDAEGASIEGGQNIWQNFREVLKVRDVWLVAMFFGLYYAACGTLTGLLPAILAERGVARSGVIVSIFMWVAIVVTPLSGIFSDGVGRRKPFLIFGATLMAICFPFLTKLHGWALVSTMLVVGTAAASVVPFKTAIPAEIEGIGVSLAATTFGFMMMIGYAMGFLGPVVSGWIMDISNSPMIAFVIMSTVLVTAAGIVIPMKETGCRPSGIDKVG